MQEDSDRLCGCRCSVKKSDSERGDAKSRKKPNRRRLFEGKDEVKLKTPACGADYCGTYTINGDQ